MPSSEQRMMQECSESWTSLLPVASAITLVHEYWVIGWNLHEGRICSELIEVLLLRFEWMTLFVGFFGTSVQSVLEIKNVLLSCRANMQHWKSVLELQQSLLCFRFAFQSSCAIPGASKWCENAFGNSADSSSVRNSPKRECLSAEMIGCLLMAIAMAARMIALKLQHNVELEYNELGQIAHLQNVDDLEIVSTNMPMAAQISKFVCHSREKMQITIKCPWELLQSAARITGKITSRRSKTIFQAQSANRIPALELIQ
ncbi:hypothetical protein Pelo_6987 [Pelomyxa schiedti]|nr:hypothetical protein Pelo_6987 [Pelomyxa schiedti]